ncbi:hypothetical protein HDV01_003394 [Terramyces sp. JEL0728]|nr:hypothetical protein HDV01_003394 [Terramyces sp. JEL0728]
MLVVVSWDWLTIFVSFWAAVFGAFTSIEVISHLLKLLVQRKLDRKKSSAKSIKSEGVVQSSCSITDPGIRLERRTFVEGMTDSYLTLFNMFIAAVALGACGIWGMHFIGIHALSFFIIPDDKSDQVDAIVSQGYFNNNHFAPLNLNVLYTSVSLFVGIFSVYFGLCTSAYAFGLFRNTLANYSKGKESSSDEPRPPIAISEADDESVIREIKVNESINNSRDHRFNESNLSKNALLSPKPSEARIQPKSTKKSNALTKLLQKMKTESAALNYLREFTFFSLCIRDRIVFVLGGIFTGLGVAGMHYCGMAAVRVANVKMTMNPMHLSVSIVIASVVATVALWILFFLRSKHAVFAASLVMGLAVCAMHYTASAGLIPEYIEGYNVDSPYAEISGFDNELLSAHLAFSFELGIINYVHRFLK